MTNHHFTSYSSADAWAFAVKLCDRLQVGPSPIVAWLDRREIRPGEDRDTQIDEAIRTCNSLIFVMTPDSVDDKSVCKKEWSRALKYKKPIVPLCLDRDAEMPFRLEDLQYIDFINPPPVIAPSYFQDRQDETRLMGADRTGSASAPGCPPG
jgi:hypothetical protein